MNSPKREHFTAMIEKSYRSLFGILVIIALNFLGESGINLSEAANRLSGKALYIALGLFALLVLLVTFSVLGWVKTAYYIDDSNFIVEKGIITRSRIAIPLSRINTVDISRNIFEQVVGTCRLKMDSGTVEAKVGSEVDLILSLTEAEALRTYILSFKDAASVADEDNPSKPEIPKNYGAGFSAKASDFIKLGITSRKLAAFMVLISLLIGWGETFFDFESLFGEFFGPGFTLEALPLIAIALAIIFIISNVVAIVRSLILYYDFKIYRAGENICVEHGLLSKKNYTLPVAKIHCVSFRQNLMQQLFHLKEISVTTMGYGDEKNETAMLFPIASDEGALNILKVLLPEFPIMGIAHKATKQALAYAVLPYSLFFAALSLSLTFTLSYYFLFILLIIPLIILQKYRIISNCGIGIGSDVIAAQSGGFTKQTAFIRKGSVQSVSKRQGPISRGLGFFKGNIDYYGSKQTLISLPYLKNNIFEYIRSFDESL